MSIHFSKLYQKQFWAVLYALIITFFCAQAQSNNKVMIEKIIIEGRKKTTEKTILRELDFQVGDSITIADLPARLKRSQEMLVNSSLFNQVEINIKTLDYEGGKAGISIKLKESWYIFPFGWVSLADRNFNVWWNEKNHDFSRLNYQVGLRWNNLTGHRDLLKISTEFGFGRKYEIDYKIPGINLKRTVGFFCNSLYSNNKEVWYATERDSLRFFRDETAPQIKRFRLLGGFTFRPHLRTTHALQISYFDNAISDAVAKDKNPNFFLLSRSKQRYFSLIYKFTKDRRNNKFYPQKGSFFALTLEKDGLLSKKESVQAFYTNFLYAKYFPIISDKFDAEFILKTRKELTNNPQPYYNTRALGYQSDYLRGYEYYVIDGANYAYLKNSFRIKLLHKNIDLGEYVPPSLRNYPITIWLTINNDLGYVQNSNTLLSNNLPNRLLWGRGIGFNIKVLQFSYYQIEISQNHLNKVGVYLHTKLPIE